MGWVMSFICITSVFVHGSTSSPRTASLSVLLKVDAAPAIHRDDLPGDVGCVGDQELHRPGDVVRLALALEQGIRDDPAALLLVLPSRVLRPQADAGRNAVHSHLGS